MAFFPTGRNGVNFWQEILSSLNTFYNQSEAPVVHTVNLSDNTRETYLPINPALIKKMEYHPPPWKEKFPAYLPLMTGSHDAFLLDKDMQVLVRSSYAWYVQWKSRVAALARRRNGEPLPFRFFLATPQSVFPGDSDCAYFRRF